MVYIILIILGYFLFRFVMTVVVPVFRATKMVRREFAKAQESFRAGSGYPGDSQSGYSGGPGFGPKVYPSDAQHGRKNPNWDKMGDYIDFEEVN
jgi:hypothetical protein